MSEGGPNSLVSIEIIEIISEEVFNDFFKQKLIPTFKIFNTFFRHKLL